MFIRERSKENWGTRIKAYCLISMYDDRIGQICASAHRLYLTSAAAIYCYCGSSVSGCQELNGTHPQMDQLPYICAHLNIISMEYQPHTCDQIVTGRDPDSICLFLEVTESIPSYEFAGGWKAKRTERLNVSRQRSSSGVMSRPITISDK